MKQELFLLTSLPYSGKTSLLRTLYRRNLSTPESLGQCLWLTPTQRSRAQALEKLFDENLTVVLNPGVMTFDLFCESILQDGDDLVRPVSEPQKRLLLKQIIEELKSKNEFSHFGSISHTRGFLSLVSNFISELKRDEIWPDQFEKAMRHGSRQDKELLLLYERYQTTLAKEGFYDAEGRYWSARTQLSARTQGRYSEFDLVIVDGFSDFTPTQYDILITLASLTRTMVVTLPFEEGQRRDLFAKSERAIQTLKDRLSELNDVHLIEQNVAQFAEQMDLKLPSGETAGPACLHLRDHLFDPPFSTTVSVQSTGLQILACYGQKNELQVVAERVKRLLANGVTPGQIIVTARDLSDPGPLAEEIFREAGIPTACDLTTPLDRTLLCKQMLQFLGLIEDDWSFERLKGVLLSTWFDWARLHPHLGLMAEGVARNAIAYLRARQIAGNGDVILDVLARDRERLEAAQRSDPGSRTRPRGFPIDLQELVSVEELFHALRKLCAPFEKKHSPIAWMELIGKTFSRLGWTPLTTRTSLWQVESGFPSDPRWPTVAAELWDFTLAQLFDLARFHERHSLTKIRWSLTEFIAFLQETLELISLPSQVREVGRVRLLPAAQIRNLDVDYLFVLGLNEKQFPQAHQENCLYSEAERTRLQKFGWQLSTRRTHDEDELLLFYHVVTRPRKLLTLSYAMTNHKGEPVFASPFLEQVRQLFDPNHLSFETAGRLHPVPAISEAMSRSSQRIAAVDEALGKQTGYLKTLLEDQTQTPLIKNVVAASKTSSARFHTEGLTVYEGMLHDPSNLRWLSRRFSPDVAFSATQLESYAYCPFRFFAEYVLNVSPYDDPRVRTDRARRGNVVHNSLAQLHHALLDDASVDEVREKFSSYLKEELGREVNVNDLHAALNRIEGQLLDEWASYYGDQHNEYRNQLSGLWGRLPQRSLLELTFGEISGLENESLPEQDESFPPLNVGSSEQSVKIRGRIDRIDIGQQGAQSVFTLIDYKTGSPKRFNEKELRSGKSLQLALYLIATIRLKLTGDDSIPWQIGFWEIHKKGFISGYKTGSRKENASFLQLDGQIIDIISDIIDDLVPRLVEHMRQGHFAVYSQDKQCTSFCDFHLTCRINQVRQLEIPLNKRLVLNAPLSNESPLPPEDMSSGGEG